jgi:hypothetical protein
MPPRFTRFLAERLSTVCALQVREAQGGERLLPGAVWIAPGGFHLAVALRARAAHLRRLETPPENSCRPSVDVLFPLTDGGVRQRRSGHRDDRNGAGWFARGERHIRRRRSSVGPGRGDLRRVGHAGIRCRERAGGTRAAVAADRPGDCVHCCGEPALRLIASADPGKEI